MSGANIMAGDASRGAQELPSRGDSGVRLYALGQVSSRHAGKRGAGLLAAAAILFGCASGTWAKPGKQPGRGVTAKKQQERTGAAVRKPATTVVRCKYADFEFTPEGDTADVVDRDFGDAGVTTIADLRSSPASFVLTWERKMGTMVGLRVMRYRYLINRETGQADIQTSDEMDGLPSVRGSQKDECAITKGAT